jgi:hypothetical protein
MILQRIISGAQTGAERAALDVAIKLNIPHGGWVPKGCIAEDGPVPDKYNLKEMATKSYPRRTEQNVIDSDGTLILTHGSLSGGSALTRKMAMKHSKTWLHIDLNKLPTFYAGIIISDWISDNKVGVLNVAGSRATKDPEIYGLATLLLELVYNLLSAKDDKPEPSQQAAEADAPEGTDQPKTVEDVLDILVGKMSIKDKSTLANLPMEDLNDLHFSLGLYIRNQFLYPRNDKLLESCRSLSGDKYLHWDQAGSVIIKELWNKLQRTHKLRVVK